MSEPLLAARIKRFCELWAEGFIQVLSSQGLVSPGAQASDPVSTQAPTPQEFENLVCIRFTGGGALKGELLWTAEKPAALQLAQILTPVPAEAAVEFGAAQRDAYAELLRQVSSQVTTAWKAETGSAIELLFQATVEPAPVTAQSSTLKLSGEKTGDLSLRLFLDEDLCNALSVTPGAEEASKQSATATASSTSSPAAEPSALPANLMLVLDVELEATIRFGQRQMLLRDIFGLMAGAVVELNQMVNEPAELLVAGRLVAKGEVVVVDGNFGLRVTEVATVNERVAALNF